MKFNAPWKYYLGFYTKDVKKITFSVILSIVQALLLLPIAFLIKSIFDSQIPEMDFEKIIIFGLIILLLNALVSILTLYTRFITLKITKNVIEKIRVNLLKNCLNFSRTHFSRFDNSILHTRIVEDTQRVDVMSNAVLAQFIPASVICILLLFVMFYLQWILFVTTICIIPVVYLISKYLSNKIKSKIQRNHFSFDRFSNSIFKAIKIFDLVKIQSALNLEIGNQKKIINHLNLSSRSMAWFMSAFKNINELLLSSFVIVVLFAGSYLYIKNLATIGEIIAFFAAANYSKKYFSLISQNINEIIEGNESLSKIYRLVSSVEIENESGKKQIDFKGNIELRDVSFGYTEKPVLGNFQSKFESGKLYIISGESGSGKSTLLNLITGFYSPDRGEILFENNCISDLDLYEIRKKIGYVTQDAIIFSGTVKENITYGIEKYTNDEFNRAVNIAFVDDFVCGFELGYDTKVGEDGVFLSGGQKQRINIARAILKKPKLLLMDEPTNNLDYSIFMNILNEIMLLESKPTILISTHEKRLYDVADVVLVIEKGALRKLQTI